MRLKELRESKNLTQKTVANYINKTPQAYSLYERGDRDPDIATISQLAQFFDVSIDYLLGTTNDPTPPEQKNCPGERTAEAMRDTFVQMLIENGIIEKVEDITPEQIELMREAFRSTMKLLKPKS